MIIPTVVLLLAVLLAIQLYPHVEDRYRDFQREREAKAEREALARDKQTRREVDFVVGFHVGHSYSASVALFRNGSTLNLAKVDGDAAYLAAMQRRIVPSEKLLHEVNGQEYDFSTPEDLEHVFLPVLQTLKERSEVVLLQPIQHVHFATPWVGQFSQPYHYPNDTFLVARRRLGLKEPFVHEHGRSIFMMPLHLNEANAVLAANGRNVCGECLCETNSLYPSGSGLNSDIFYISLNRASLFFSKQKGSCAVEVYAVDMSLYSDYGLEQLDFQDSQQYWSGLRARLLSDITPYYRDSNRTATLVLAGEGGTDPRLRSVAESIRTELLALRNIAYISTDGKMRKFVAKQDPVDILVAKDGVFDAARGATAVMKSDFWGYCDGVDNRAMYSICLSHYMRNGIEWVGICTPEGNGCQTLQPEEGTT